MSSYNLWCTSTFIKEYERINKKQRHYGSLSNDLYNFLYPQTAESIFEQQEFIDNKPPQYRLIKVRLAISGTNKSEREGFRMYYNVINKNANTDVCLLYIYPKIGPLGADSLNTNFIKLQTQIFAKEKNETKLYKITLNNKTKEVEIKAA